MATKVFYIDFSGVSTREAMFRKLAETLPVPSDYIRNLDALHDALTEYGSGWNIIIYNTTETQKALGSYFQRFQRLCADLAKEQPDLRIRIYP